MCCFSVPTPKSFLQRLMAPKIHVSATNIFARIVAPGVQALAYSMNIATAREVAMILPVPVRPGTGESALRFVDLEKHSQMFAELDALFETETVGQPKSRGISRDARPTLAVHQVGSFIATYVPTKTDFDRVDRRFWLPRILLDSVPTYADYGFAVFQLQKGKKTIHPMAFTFPSRELDRLYFPTVHLHDGRFHHEAAFDHTLYYQHPRVGQPPKSVQARLDAMRARRHAPEGSPERDEVSLDLPIGNYAGLADTTRAVLRRAVRGTHPNQDTWIKTGRPATVPPI